MSEVKRRLDAEEARIADLERSVGIGHNMPPGPTPYEAARDKINELYEESSLWLDGQPIASQEQADGLAALLRLMQDAAKRAEDARKAEVKPLDEAKAAIQARYAPLIGDTKAGKGKAVRAIDSMKAAHTAWLVKLDQAKREAARKAREEADRQAREAQEAVRAADRANIVEMEAAERRIAEAKAAEAAASKAERDKAGAKGFAGRGVGLRTTYEPEVADVREACRHYFATRPEAFAAVCLQLAREDFRRGLREVPGIRCVERKTAV